MLRPARSTTTFLLAAALIPAAELARRSLAPVGAVEWAVPDGCDRACARAFREHAPTLRPPTDATGTPEQAPVSLAASGVALLLLAVHRRRRTLRRPDPRPPRDA